MPEPKSSSPRSHKLTKENQISGMMLRGNKFLRRHDLTPSIRLYIAFTALMARTSAIGGQISQLSRQLMISRMFVYMLANTLHETSLIVFGDNLLKPPVIDERPWPVSELSTPEWKKVEASFSCSFCQLGLTYLFNKPQPD